MKDVKTKRALGPLGGGGLMHTAQGLGTIAAMRPRLSWVQSAQTLVGPARAPVFRKNKPRVVEKKQKHTHVRPISNYKETTGVTAGYKTTLGIKLPWV